MTLVLWSLVIAVSSDHSSIALHIERPLRLLKSSTVFVSPLIHFLIAVLYVCIGAATRSELSFYWQYPLQDLTIAMKCKRC